MNHENMKMTEVGWIPKDWEVKTLEEIGNFSKGRGVSRDQSHSGNLPCVRYGELYTSHDNYIRNFYSFISQEVAETAKRLNKGDVLFAASGETKEEIGKAVAFVGNEEAYAGGDIIILSPKIESDSMFLGFALNGEESVRQKSALGQGDAVVHIHAPELSKVSIAFPNPSEQRRIAQVLSDTDSLIASLSRTIEKKRLVKQGAMQQLLTGKTRLKGFSGEWVEKELGEVVYVLDNKRLPLNDSQRKHGIYPYCGANGIVDYIDDYIFDEELILMAEDGGNFGDYETRPIAYIMQGKYWVNNHAHVLKAREEYCQRFIYHSIAHKNITDLIIGGTRAKLNQAVLKGIGITMPPTFDEQFAIANILTTMDNEIVSLEAELQKYKALKQGMMQKLLTGQIRLK